MLGFRPEDPFPLDIQNASYEEEKRHSAEADLWLGLCVPEVESKLCVITDGQERWAQKGPATFLTPYTELRKILTELAPVPGDLLVDLGAGYGRMAFVIERHFPGVRFLGYELVPERVAEGRRVLLERGCEYSELLEADLAAIKPAAAQFYFLYDYGTRAAIAKTLADLREIALTQAVILVGRGRAVRDAVERDHPWLGGVVPPKHQGNYSVYRSSPV